MVRRHAAPPALPALLLAAAAGGALPPKPNLVFILSDDLGYGDYSIAPHVNATFRLPTPNVERMARGGMKFLRGYSGQVCAPSRCTLMTGRDLGHCTIRGNDGAYTPLLGSDVTVAAVLRGAGYRTGIVGKWGLGNFGTTGYPLQQGYDYYVGQDTQVGCHDWYPKTVKNNTDPQCVINSAADLDFTTCLSDKAACTWANDLDKTLAVKFIRESAGPTPFFLYLATTTPHAGFLTGSGTKPPGFVKSFPVPYPYNQQYLNESGDGWSDTQRQFAAAVWAQDVMVGAVLDQLAASKVEDKTVVFFSGDNGPDSHPFQLFDDPGPFRGKKRSLHEGGIRQTIVVQWPGTIPAGTASDAIFAFWDLLPTAADLAGVPPEQRPPHEGISAAPIFAASALGGDALAAADAAAAASGRFLYYEFCINSKVNGLLPQSYAPGWSQAVRWDDNNTAYRTEWKGIVSNSDAAALLLYNITDDQSESKPLLPAEGGDVDPAVARARDIIVAIMAASHVENPYWKSSKNASDKCCASCFSPGGCAYPCKKMTPPPAPPTPPPPPTPAPAPIPLSDLSGDWNELNPHAKIFTLGVAASGEVTLGNPSDSSSCWTNGTGTISADGTAIRDVVAVGPKCVRHASGSVRRKKATVVVDVDYPYTVTSLEIVWAVTVEGGGKGSWPDWGKTVGAPAIVLDQ